MRLTSACLFVVLLGLTAFSADPPKPKFKLSKETTYITEPLDKDGYLDYETALNERLRGKITPETNAVVMLCQIFGPKPEGAEMHADFYKWLGIAAPPEKGDYFVSLDRFIESKSGKYPTQDELIAIEGDADKVWARKDRAILAEWLDAMEKPIETVRQMSHRKVYYYPLVSSRKDNGERKTLLDALNPHVQRTRMMAFALSRRAMLRLGEGKTEEAWDDLMAVQRLGRLVARGGTYIESLVGHSHNTIACNAALTWIEHAKPNSTRARKCIEELQSLSPFPNLVDKMDLAQRYIVLDSTQSLRRDGSEIGGGIELPEKPGPEREAVLDLFPWSVTFETVTHNYNRALRIARMTDREEKKNETERQSRELEGQQVKLRTNIARKTNIGYSSAKSVGIVLFDLMMPAIQRMQNTQQRIEQQHHNLQLAFALAAYRADNSKYPAKLDDLAPKYLAKIPIDLFSAKPLLYKLTEKGYLLYSVGENGQDDGGATFGDDPKGDDLRVRMPNLLEK